MLSGIGAGSSNAYENRPSPEARIPIQVGCETVKRADVNAVQVCYRDERAGVCTSEADFCFAGQWVVHSWTDPAAGRGLWKAWSGKLMIFRTLVLRLATPAVSLFAEFSNCAYSGRPSAGPGWPAFPEHDNSSGRGRSAGFVPSPWSRSSAAGAPTGVTTAGLPYGNDVDEGVRLRR